jgi:SAM-dependent methyltransferase
MSHDFWERAAQIDPLWAILSDPTKKGRHWDLQSFFETGRREVSLLLYQLRQLGRLPSAERALDFGCGVGRLTQALGATFAEVVGVDVSPTMIRLAERLNRRPATVRYVLNQSPALDQLGSSQFDLIYSDIVLQHLEPEAATGFIREFLRLLAPGGVTVFQLPSHKRSAAESQPSAQNMAPEAYRARITLVEPPPGSMSAGQSATTVVEVCNTSRMPWHQHATGTMRVGNHWREGTGNMLVQDDGRANLPSTIEPGAVVRMAIELTAPDQSGLLTCEFDVVHEGLSWFGDRGSPTLRIEIQVEAADADLLPPTSAAAGTLLEPEHLVSLQDLLGPAGADEIGAFPMHGVLQETVIDLIRANGGSVFFVEEDDRGGAEWKGFRYFATKSE